MIDERRIYAETAHYFVHFCEFFFFIKKNEKNEDIKYLR